MEDLDRIDAFNLGRSAAWTRHVQNRIGERCATLPSMPGQGRLVGDFGWRELSIADIQYVVTYEPIGDYIVIHRVRHSRESRIEQ